MVRDYDYLTETVETDHFSRWEEVDLEIYAFTDLGMKVAINDEYYPASYMATRFMSITKRGRSSRVIFWASEQMVELMFRCNRTRAGMCIQLLKKFSSI